MLETITNVEPTRDPLTDEERAAKAARKVIIIRRVLARMAEIDPNMAAERREAIRLKLGVMSADLGEPELTGPN